MCSRRVIALVGTVAASLFVAGSALAQLTSAEQKCIDGYNNKLRLVSQQAGKSARSCVKNAAKAGTDPDNCIVTNTDGKIAGKESKVTDLYTAGKCTGAEPIQQGAATGNAAHRNGITDFVHEVLGDPVGVLPINKDDGKCLDKGVQRSTQAITEIIKAHRSCKKNGMKAGSITDEATLDTTCGTFLTIDGGGKAAAKLAKISTDVTAACATTTTPIASLFDGLDAGCHASATALGLCLQRESRCAACLILNEADGQDIDCDTFDDALANASCGGYPAINIGSHVCTLGAGSSLALSTAALPLNVVPSGTFSVDCGTTAPDGTAACSCDVLAFAPVVIPSIGDVCVNPAAGCAAGKVDCDGGSALDVDLKADHNIGACASNAACATACATHCSGFGANYAVLSSGCEGLCSGGANNELACTLDSDCPGGQCVGKEPVTHPGICNCACSGDELGAPAGPGALSCQLGVQIDVELPNDGDCLDADTIKLAPQCGGITTTTSTGIIVDTNNGDVGSPPTLPAGGRTLTGTAIDCSTLASSTTAGLKMVGQLAFFDSTFGDIESGQTFVCQ